MRTVIQRVKNASVSINSELKSSINEGLLILLGIGNEDNKEDAEWLIKKCLNLRIFNDDQGIMNRSVLDINGEVLIVSQFTLMASYKKGNRPSYINAARPEIAIPLYKYFCKTMSEQLGKDVRTGEFGADMKVELLNDGPVTICMDTHNKE